MDQPVEEQGDGVTAPRIWQRCEHDTERVCDACSAYLAAVTAPRFTVDRGATSRDNYPPRVAERIAELIPFVEQQRARFAHIGGFGNTSLDQGALHEMRHRAQHEACWCGRCGENLAPDAAVWRTRRDLICTTCWQDSFERRTLMWRMVGRPCLHCNRPVHKRGWPRDVFCCAQCEARYVGEQRRAQRAAARAGRVCSQCGETFEPPRSDAKYCSATCRQRAHRARNVTAAAAQVATTPSTDVSRDTHSTVTADRPEAEATATIRDEETAAS